MPSTWGDVVVVKAAQYVEDGVRLAYVGKELVAQSFPLAGPLDQSGDIDNLDGGRHDASRVDQLGELVQRSLGTVMTPTLVQWCRRGSWQLVP